MTGFADQTPTPTRFIRNCEEVGLFQDLQNVNPFEETFRKAVEAVNQGEPPLLGRATASSYPDDTLHTPNVFPTINDPHHLGGHTNTCEPSTAVGEKTPQIQTMAPPKRLRTCKRRKDREQNSRLSDKGQIPLPEPHFVVVDRNVTFKLPVPRMPPSIKVFSPKYFSVFSKNAVKTAAHRESNNQESVRKIVKGGPRGKEEILESNRLAQMRTREKKKHYMAYLEQFNKELIEKNNRLEKKLSALSEENSLLKCQLTRTQRLSGVNSVCNVSLQTDYCSPQFEKAKDAAEGTPLNQDKQNVTESRILEMVSHVDKNGHKKERESESTVKAPYDGRSCPSATVILKEERVHCFYSSLAAGSGNVDVIANVNDLPNSQQCTEGFLRKPFKKRTLHPKLNLESINLHKL